jgi:nicotinate-nucleotide adenylyltransferase
VERIALCGGTFDPFHLGHLHAPLSVCEEFGWDRIIFLPAWKQPFKLDRETTSGYHRFAMAVLATREYDFMSVSPLELERGNISYTVDTLETFRSENPNAVLDWIIGDDNLEQLLQWRKIERIFALANFAVLARSTKHELPEPLQGRVSPPSSRGRSGSICFARNATIPISSTAVRDRLRRGESVKELVHPDVMHYIDKHRLYTTTEVTN